jgi:predicted RNase H-like HicB family nuclease
MTSRALLRLLTSRRFNCVVLRQRGSHVIVHMRDVPDGHTDALQGSSAGDLERHPIDTGAVSGREVVGVSSQRRFKVTIRRDPEDRTAWLVNVVGTPGAHTFGRSLAEAKRHGVEVVALWFELEPDEFVIDWDIRLADLAESVKQARAAMAHAEVDRQRRDNAVRALMEAGISYRDIAELLGLSHQRVAQIAKAS